MNTFRNAFKAVRLGFLAVFMFALVACLPTNQPTPDPNNATLTLEQGTEYHVLKFGAGSADALTAHLEVAGLGVRVNDPKCHAESGKVVCDLGLVPKEKFYVLPITGLNLAAWVKYQRASGGLYELFSP